MSWHSSSMTEPDGNKFFFRESWLENTNGWRRYVKCLHQNFARVAWPAQNSWTIRYSSWLKLNLPYQHRNVWKFWALSYSVTNADHLRRLSGLMWNGNMWNWMLLMVLCKIVICLIPTAWFSQVQVPKTLAKTRKIYLKFTLIVQKISSSIWILLLLSPPLWNSNMWNRMM